MNDSEVICLDITSPDMMVECEDKNKMIQFIMKQKPDLIPCISKQ